MRKKERKKKNVQIYQCNEAINVARLHLTESIHAKYTLYVVRWIPRDIEYDNAISCNQIDAQTTGTCRN